MVVTCDIDFEQNRKGCYFAGQLVSGTIILKCDKVKEIKAILLKISGFARVSWSEKKFYTQQVYQGCEDYLATETYLLGSEESLKTSLATGVHTYTFACQLPKNCPSSFEGLHGHVRYTVEVTLIRPWKFDQIYRKGFTVLKMTDLNFESPNIRIPSTSESYRSFWCGPCKTQPLKMELKIPQAGYVPGQNIPVQALIINNTNIAVSDIKFALIMIVRYISQNPSNNNIQRINVSNVFSNSVPRYCTGSIRELIHVPATPPTCMHSCSIIHIAYEVEMVVKMQSFHNSAVVVMPVIIGNIPLANNIRGTDAIKQQPSGSEDLEREINISLNKEDEVDIETTLDLLSSNIPPPSYEISFHTVRNNINADEPHAFGYCEFAPLYTVYNIPSPTLDEPNKYTGVENRGFVL